MTSNARTTESLGFPVDGVPQINNLFDDPVSRPAYGNAGGHSGIDFGTANGVSPVLAMAAGTVTKVVTDQVGGGEEDNYDRTVPNTYHPDHPLGNQVQIRTSDGDVHGYGHLHTLSVEMGEQVTKGRQLGIAGAAVAVWLLFSLPAYADSCPGYMESSGLCSSHAHPHGGNGGGTAPYLPPLHG